MLLRACLVVAVLGASGCLHHAKLAAAREAVETFNAPVRCGPMGFRRAPLQARFGEYLRLTVRAPVALSGSVMVHANGLAHPARTWTSASGEGLVVEARFENTDPDLPSALRATQPIDVTLTDLNAPAGGTCEGAVFTLEHGRLVPPTTDALWLAELERRGGAELAARREARRHLSEEELARETESAQPEFSTVLAGWDAPQRDEALTPTAGEMDMATASEADAWALPPGARGNASRDTVAVAQLNVDSPSMTRGAQTMTQRNVNTSDGSVAVAQLNVDSPSMTRDARTMTQTNANTSGGSVAIAQVNVAADYAQNNALGAYDDANAQRAPALPTVGAAFPAGCTELACVIPAPQCTAGCTPAPGTCTASRCTVDGQVIEVAAFPRGCVSTTCTVPLSRCTGACTQAPGAFVNGSYSCPAQSPATSIAAATDTEWNAPPSVTTQVAYEVPQPAAQVIVAAPPPEVDVVVPVLPWILGALLSAPLMGPMPAPGPRYAPTPMHDALPVGGPRGRR